MKVTLDLDVLVAEGKLTAAEAERLKRFSAGDTNTLGSNIFLAFGIMAVVIGTAVFIPTVETAIVVGALLFGLGLWLRLGKVERWSVFAQIVMVIGAITLCGGIATLFQAQVWVAFALSFALAGVAVLTLSGLMASLAVFMFAGGVLRGTNVWYSTDHLAIAIAVSLVLILALYLISLRLKPAYERLAIIAMRTAILMANVGFFLGSLLGDSFFDWSRWAFTISWAVALIAFGTWAIYANRRWVVNTVAVFAAIHFFTQWFVVLGAQPFSILGGGLLLIGFGLALAGFNNRLNGGKGTEPLAA